MKCERCAANVVPAGAHLCVPPAVLAAAEKLASDVFGKVNGQPTPPRVDCTKVLLGGRYLRPGDTFYEADGALCTVRRVAPERMTLEGTGGRILVLTDEDIDPAAWALRCRRA